LKLLAIIPARGGSKGVPGKNIKLLGGKPLIWYTYEAARASALFDDIILSTDDENIASIAKSFGLNIPFLRPKELASDAAKSIDVVIHCLDFFKAQEKDFDAVVLLQPTSPFREKGLIAKAIKLFIEKKVDSLISVRKVPHQFNPHWLFVANEDGILQIATGDEELIGRRQELPDAFYRDGQIYITETTHLITNKSFIGKNATYILNENEGSAINIDNQEDWLIAEQFINKNIVEF
jgi:CMP-N,N'-diacetyllegionaminic acid synthase